MTLNPSVVRCDALFYRLSASVEAHWFKLHRIFGSVCTAFGSPHVAPVAPHLAEVAPGLAWAAPWLRLHRI